MDFFHTDFGTIVLWVIAGIVLIPIAIGAIIVALGAILWTVFHIVWVVAKLFAIVLVISGVAYLVLYFTGNLSMLQL